MERTNIMSETDLQLIDSFCKLGIERRELRKEIDTKKSLREQVSNLQRFLRDRKDIPQDILHQINDTIDIMLTFHYFHYPEVKEKIKRVADIDTQITKILYMSRKRRPDVYIICKTLQYHDKN